MAALKEKAIALLSSTASVNMKDAGATVLYNVPTGKTAIITKVVIRNTSASLAGGTEYEFGVTAAYNEFKGSINLAAMTTSGTSYWVATNENGVATRIAAGGAFSINVVTGSTAPCTATIEVFGYLV